MNSDIEKVLAAIVCYVVEHRGYVTKTKLLKLLYLFDVEYFRVHRQTFTRFQWKFFHLGPWTAEYEPILEGLVAQDVLIESQSSRSDFDTRFYRTSEHIDLDAAIPGIKDEMVLKSILKRWGDCSTGEILDYVYFRTEPMEFGIRNELLDFSHIAEQKPLTYSRPSSGRSEKEVQALRLRFKHRGPQHSETERAEPTVTPPRYDDEFFEAMSKLEEPRR